MDTERRKFLQHMALMCGAGVARSLGVGVGVAVASSGTAAVASAATAIGAGTYGQGVRQQVFEVIVRQAMAGAPWQTICKGPMAVNGITEEEIRKEVSRRIEGVHTAGLHTVDSTCFCRPCGEERRQRYVRATEKIRTIPHSATSPCACTDCRRAIAEIVNNIWKQV
jgi:hypothetical protein